jgi:hypothetical protein
MSTSYSAANGWIALSISILAIRAFCSSVSALTSRSHTQTHWRCHQRSIRAYGVAVFVGLIGTSVAKTSPCAIVLISRTCSRTSGGYMRRKLLPDSRLVIQSTVHSVSSPQASGKVNLSMCLHVHVHNSITCIETSPVLYYYVVQAISNGLLYGSLYRCQFPALLIHFTQTEYFDQIMHCSTSI